MVQGSFTLPQCEHTWFVQQVGSGRALPFGIDAVEDGFVRVEVEFSSQKELDQFTELVTKAGKGIIPFVP